MMKVGIMQPYLFPYIGYWQLINAVDKYVILDDVNYIKRGYINRNSILINGKANRFSIPVVNASQNKLICETKLSFTNDEKKQFLCKIRMAYSKAPFFNNCYALLEDIISNENDDLTDYIVYSIEKINDYLGIKTPLVKSSELEKGGDLKGQERIISICKRLGADTYINPSGGRELYSNDRFKKENINLFFLDVETDSIKYNQFKNEFVSNLSIIDLLMFNSVVQIKDMLEKYNLNK